MHKRILFSGTENPVLLYISETTVDASFHATQHAHPNLEILFFTDGEGEVVTPYRKYPVRKDDLMVINAHTEHCEASGSFCRFYAIGVHHTEAFSETEFRDNIFHHSFEKACAERIGTLYRLMYDEAAERAETTHEFASHLFAALTLLLNRYLNVTLSHIEIADRGYLVAAVKQIVESYFYSDIRIADIAARLSVSVSTLCHSFKAAIGMSVLQYQLRCQMEEAKNLLSITDMSVSEIAGAVGFHSSAYFAKIFRRQNGISPREYRLRCR